MELLLSILLWLGLISNGSTYTASQIQDLESQHRAAIEAKKHSLEQPSANVLPPSLIDISIVGP